MSSRLKLRPFCTDGKQWKPQLSFQCRQNTQSGTINFYFKADRILKIWHQIFFWKLTKHKKYNIKFSFQNWQNNEHVFLFLSLKQTGSNVVKYCHIYTKNSQRTFNDSENHCCLVTLQGSWTRLHTWTSILCVWIGFESIKTQKYWTQTLSLANWRQNWNYLQTLYFKENKYAANHSVWLGLP